MTYLYASLKFHGFVFTESTHSAQEYKLCQGHIIISNPNSMNISSGI